LVVKDLLALRWFTNTTTIEKFISIKVVSNTITIFNLIYITCGGVLIEFNLICIARGGAQIETSLIDIVYASAPIGLNLNGITYSSTNWI
jgi:hypothetical protein